MALTNQEIYYFDISKIGRDFTGKKDISILYKQIDEADFYYMIGIGFSGVRDYEFNYEKIMNELDPPLENLKAPANEAPPTPVEQNG